MTLKSTKTYIRSFGGLTLFTYLSLVVKVARISPRWLATLLIESFFPSGAYMKFARFCFAFSVSVMTATLAPTTWSAADEQSGSGQPPGQLGLVEDHDPVTYSGYGLYFVEGKLEAHDQFTQTWSIIERKEGKSEHAFKIVTHQIEQSADASKPTFMGRNAFEDKMENFTRYELFHQDDNRNLVLDAVEGHDGEAEKREVPEGHYIFPGNLKIGTKWKSEPVLASLEGTCQFEVIGSEIFKGTNCWVISLRMEDLEDPQYKKFPKIEETGTFLFDPTTLTVMRSDLELSGIGPLGRSFRFVWHSEIDGE